MTQLLTRELAKNGTTIQPCHVYPGLCTSVDGEDGDQVDENGRHFDHGGRTYSVPSADLPEDPEIWAAFTHVSTGVPHIAFIGENLTPDQTRVKATDLRQMADDMDALADQVEVVLADTARKDGGKPLSAARRGPEWMTRWGCTPWCVEDHALPFAAEWHSTPKAETDLRDTDIDSSGHSANGNSLPWLAARVIVSNYKPQEYGRETQVWLDYGLHTAELSLAKAREALTAMRGFVAQLGAVVEQAEEIAADDFEGDPEIARLDREADDRRSKARTTELRAAKA